MITSILARTFLRGSGGGTFSPLKTCVKGLAKIKLTCGDPIELATGLEKRERLARLAGNTDPWHEDACKVGTGTKDDPIQIPSAFDARLVGCICNEEAMYPNYMWLYENEPKRCECGRWFCLVHVEAFG